VHIRLFQSFISKNELDINIKSDFSDNDTSIPKALLIKAVHDEVEGKYTDAAAHAQMVLDLIEDQPILALGARIMLAFVQVRMKSAIDPEWNFQRLETE